VTATIGAPSGTGVRTSSITLGSRRDRDVGDVSALAASIAADGLAHPLVLTTTHRLVSGARRLEACTILGWTQIPAVTVTGIGEALELMEAELADPRHTEPLAKPLTVAEAMSLGAALAELKPWPKMPNGQGVMKTRNERRRRYACVLGLNIHQHAQARELWQAAQGFRETYRIRKPVSQADQARATALFAAIRHRRDIHGAYRQYQEEHAAQPASLPVPEPRQVTAFRAAPSRSPTPSGRRSPQRAPAAQLQAGLASVHGTVAALLSACPAGATPPPNQDAFAEEIGRLIRDLSTLRRRLTRQPKGTG
jgi:hypothetical protein